MRVASQDTPLRVVLIAPVTADDQAGLAAIDPRIELHDAWDLFAPELVADWPAQTVDWYLPRHFRDLPDGGPDRRDQLLASADVLCLTFPFPTHLVSRARRLRFVQQLPAGVSNLVYSDLWLGPVPITSGRGAANSLVMAEWAIGASLALCKEFPRAFSQRQVGSFDHQAFKARQLAGKTMAVVGLGGIGREVARLASALGMRVIGSRRSAEPVTHVERVYPPSALHTMLAKSDFVVLCAQLTDETHHLIDEAALQAMKPSAFLLNVARGELIDEAALLRALQSGQLGGFAADVYIGEFERQPPPELLASNNVLLTPHTSARTDQPSGAAVEVFKENLRRCLNGQPLLNLVDWSRGY
jgi:phosphoglycerate dehydrogenase-like enzyme